MFKITFADMSIEEGKSTDGSWKTLKSTEPILKLEYSYTYSKKLVLQGYEEYNHLVEKQAIIGQSEAVITKIFVMGRRAEVADVFTIDLKTRQVTKKTVALGQEYQGQETTGWRPGVSSNPGYDDGA